ncbi:iron-containing redox enzyme family protein [soil metagenome]
MAAPHEIGDPPPWDCDPLFDDELHLALYLCYELHYRGFDGVDEGWEWDPALLAVRAGFEALFLDALIEEAWPARPVGDIEDELRTIIAGGSGPSLSGYMASAGTLEQLREFAVHRSAYQLKEADPHTWALPRLDGRAKAAMVEIQADEYGSGVLEDMHASLFADTMVALDLDATYGRYLDRLPGTTLATVNLVSLFGLHRRWRGALVGHLALFEMTSVVPMGRYAEACERLGVPEARPFYDVHVLADVHHEVLAAEELAGGLVEDEPALASDVAFGARAVMAVEGRFAQRLHDAWAAGRSSLSPR